MSVTVIFLNVFLVKAKIANTVEFVGSESCQECHEVEFKAWKGSDHDMAMKHADEQSVLGDFDNSVFEFDDKENRFFRKGKEYWVDIEGIDNSFNSFNDFKISYTFGYKPLQQYMIEFDDGRIQLIPFAWNTRPESAGGQRWYNLYPKMQNSDEFYWMNRRAFDISRDPQQLFARCNLLVTNSKTKLLHQEANKCINELSQYTAPEVMNMLLKKLNEK